MMVINMLKKLFPVMDLQQIDLDEKFFLKYNELVQLKFVRKNLVIAMIGILIFHSLICHFAQTTVLLCVTTFIPLIIGAMIILLIAFFSPGLMQYIPPTGILMIFLTAINICFMIMEKLITYNWIVLYLFYFGVSISLYYVSYRKLYRQFIDIVQNTLPSHFPYFLSGLLVYPLTTGILHVVGPVAIVLALVATLFLTLPRAAKHMILFRYYNTIQRLKIRG